MTNLGSSSNLAIMYESIKNDVDNDLVTLVMGMADIWVANKIGSLTVAPSATKQGQAADLYAMALILRMAFDTDSTESNTAVWYEEQATEILGVESNDQSKYFYGDFYASSKTPTDATLEEAHRRRRKQLPYEPDIFVYPNTD